MATCFFTQKPALLCYSRVLPALVRACVCVWGLAQFSRCKSQPVPCLEGAFLVLVVLLLPPPLFSASQFVGALEGGKVQVPSPDAERGRLPGPCLLPVLISLSSKSAELLSPQGLDRKP